MNQPLNFFSHSSQR